MERASSTTLSTLDKQGDYKANVLKVNIPRSDLSVTVANVKTPTPFGFGGWVALTKGTGGMDVMMGDLVLTEDEVNPVMSALLDNGLEVTAAAAPTASSATTKMDTAKLASEVRPVLKALRKNGLDIVAIHHHMIQTQPTVYLLTIGERDQRTNWRAASSLRLCPCDA